MATRPSYVCWFRAFPRDRIDSHVVDDVRFLKGRIGYLPVNLEQSTGALPYPDRDSDGMNDEWERRVGADPEKSDPWEDASGDGVSNLDAFLSYREGVIAP